MRHPVTVPIRRIDYLHSQEETRPSVPRVCAAANHSLLTSTVLAVYTPSVQDVCMLPHFRFTFCARNALAGGKLGAEDKH